MTTLEDFSSDQAGEIMDMSAEDIERLAQEAVSEIDRESSTSVLIIEAVSYTHLTLPTKRIV